MSKRKLPTPALPFKVGISSTCSGAWPVIYEPNTDPDTGEEWNREVGKTNTAFVGDYDRATRAVCWNDDPRAFKRTENSYQEIATAYLFAAAPVMADVLRAVLRSRASHSLKLQAYAALKLIEAPYPLPRTAPNEE